MNGIISSKELVCNTNVAPLLNKVFNYNQLEKANYLVWDLTKTEKRILEQLLHHINYKTGQVLISKSGLSEKVKCDRKTVTRFYKKCAEHDIIKLGRQGYKKNGDWGYCKDVVNLDNFSVGHFMSHTLTNVNNISNITKEEDVFVDLRKEKNKAARRLMPRNEKEEKELIENFTYYGANKKRLDELGWEKTINIKKAFHGYLRKTPIPKYLQELLNTILWTEEAINVYFPTWLKKTIEMQKQYGNKFIPYHVREEFKYAKTNGLIRYESKDRKNSYLEINKQRLREYRRPIQENNLNPLMPQVKKIKTLTEAETLALIAEKGIDNIFRSNL